MFRKKFFFMGLLKFTFSIHLFILLLMSTIPVSKEVNKTSILDSTPYFYRFNEILQFQAASNKKDAKFEKLLFNYGSDV